jgi:hydroxypyruvate reductase
VNTIKGTARALERVSGLSAEDTVLFLVSGGGSALFEKPREGITSMIWSE